MQMKMLMKIIYHTSFVLTVLFVGLFLISFAGIQPEKEIEQQVPNLLVMGIWMSGTGLFVFLRKWSGPKAYPFLKTKKL